MFSDFRWYRSLDKLTIGQSGRPPVFALQMKGRFTEDAPLSGFSSVSLPGYTMGNYLSEDYAHLLMEGYRFLESSGSWHSVVLSVSR